MGEWVGSVVDVRPEDGPRWPIRTVVYDLVGTKKLKWHATELAIMDLVEEVPIQSWEARVES